jgi:hypothetical protein
MPRSVRAKEFWPKLLAEYHLGSLINLVRMAASHSEPTPGAETEHQICPLPQKEQQAERHQHHGREDDADRGPR